MSLILGLDTSGKTSSAAIVSGERILSQAGGQNAASAESLVALVQSCCAEAQVGLPELSALAAAAGPGSFTGLRTGIAAAQGLACALGLPLYAVSVLLARSLPVLEPGAVLVPWIRASARELFYASFAAQHAANAPDSQSSRWCVSSLGAEGILPADSSVHEIAATLAAQHGLLPVVFCADLDGATGLYLGQNPASLAAKACLLKFQAPGHSPALPHWQHSERNGTGIHPIYIKGVSAKTLAERRIDSSNKALPHS